MYCVDYQSSHLSPLRPCIWLKKIQKESGVLRQSFTRPFTLMFRGKPCWNGSKRPVHTYLFTRVTFVGDVYYFIGRVRTDLREREREKTPINISLRTSLYFSAHRVIGKRRKIGIRVAKHSHFARKPQTANVFMHTSGQIARGSNI